MKPKVEEMMLEEVKIKEAMEETLGKKELEIELDAAFEAQGGEEADLSKAFPDPDEEKEADASEPTPMIQDAEFA